ncbi:unnamed protein product [Pipistrellus nathusii]|uniref:Uncharacterized protein n=1 Tax=Pipistrellus nathusii TaxID=59473 RepID=A0ABN9ZME4_PIPNA
MRDALVDVLPIQPGAVPASLSCPPKQFDVDVVFSAFSLPCCLPVLLLLLLLLCLVMWLRSWALPPEPQPLFPGLSMEGKGGAELKQLGSESWGALWALF